MTVAGTVETFDAGSFRASLATSIEVEPAAVTLNVTAASVRITATIVLVENATGVIASVQHLVSNITALSQALNVTVDSVGPTTITVRAVVAPSTPPPSPSSPPPSLPPSPPPPSPPTIDLIHVIMGVLGTLLAAGLVCFYLFYRRVSRDRANLRISRDRANFDLEMVTHQVKIRVLKESDDLASLPDSYANSLPSKRTAASALPPGPPSSSASQSVAEHEMTSSGAANNGVAPRALAPLGEQIISARPTARVLQWAFPGWHGTSGRAASAKKKRPAPTDDPSAPRVKKERFTSPCAHRLLNPSPLAPSH